MTCKEYVNDYCHRCGKCDGSDYHKYHCTEIDTVEETWEAVQAEVIVKQSKMTKERIKTIIELFISWNGENTPIDVANIDSAVDYIYSCQEPIDEDKLDELAFNEWHHNDNNTKNDFQSGFVAGYRKANEE